MLSLFGTICITVMFVYLVSCFKYKASWISGIWLFPKWFLNIKFTHINTVVYIQCAVCTITINKHLFFYRLNMVFISCLPDLWNIWPGTTFNEKRGVVELMLGTFPKVFSKRQLPKSIFPSDNFPNVHFPKQQLPIYPSFSAQPPSLF